ncbi:hypothetical protein PENTCL1PPCAC_6595 [Pristionchus entomophagus]|uniref:Probable arginine--tRNA ligase, mitochondrial n=1 Tax=Pristionchus entomophagus TaxID=358040 RepID=A0AAV5SWG3_9BILA|nr:hypothetical protein PENTCL1PPCAC_6595 [Pristionchus entomophagus]
MVSTGISLSQLRQHGLMQLLKKSQPSTTQKIVIDYSSPNIAKRFHVGNLRSTLIGRYTAKLNSTIGHHVHSINYLGDWGRQMALIIAYWPKVRPSDSYWNSIGDGEKVRLLTDCYVVGNRAIESDEQLKEDVRRIHDKMERIMLEGGEDNEEMTQWRNIVRISINHLNHFYSLFDCHFNEWMCESEESRRARLLVSDLLEKGSVKIDGKGVIMEDGEVFHQLGRTDGTSLYLTRDITSLLYRDSMWKADKYTYVVERAQRNHFATLKRVMELMGYEDLAQKITHLSYGRVKGLSTRKGRTEVVEEILESGKELAKEWMEKSPTAKQLTQQESEDTSLKLAISSLVVTEMRRARNSDYEFSWRRTFDPSGGNNAIFLHSKYSRLCSIEEANIDLMNGLDEYPIIEEPSSIPLISSLLSLYSSAISSSHSMESHELTNSLLSLGRECGRAGVTLRVKGSEEKMARSRLALLSLAKRTIEESMGILGIPIIKKM